MSPERPNFLRGSRMSALSVKRFAILAHVATALFAAELSAGPQHLPVTLKSREKVEEFEYFVNDGERKTGTRRVLTLDLGRGVKMDVVRIEAGRFIMGSPPDEKAREADEVQHAV